MIGSGSLQQSFVSTRAAEVKPKRNDIEQSVAKVFTDSDGAIDDGLNQTNRTCKGFLCKPATTLGARCHYILFASLCLLYFVALGVHFGYAANQERLAEIRYTMNVASYEPASHNLSTVAPYIVKTQVENYYDVSLKYMVLFPLFFWGITVYLLALCLPKFAGGIIKDPVTNTLYLLRVVIWSVAYTWMLYQMGDDGYNLSIVGAAPLLALALLAYLVSMIEKVMFQGESSTLMQQYPQITLVMREWTNNIMWGTVLIAVNGVVFALLAFVPVINIFQAAQKENKTIPPALQALLAVFLIETILAIVDIGATMYRLYHHFTNEPEQAQKVEVVSEYLHVFQHLTIYSIVLVTVWFGSEVLLRAYLV